MCKAIPWERRFALAVFGVVAWLGFSAGLYLRNPLVCIIAGACYFSASFIRWHPENPPPHRPMDWDKEDEDSLAAAVALFVIVAVIIIGDNLRKLWPKKRKQ